MFRKRLSDRYCWRSASFICPMMCAISRAMSSNVDCSSCFAETSLYSASRTASRSPSSVSAAPVVMVMVRMSGSEALDGARFVGMDLDEVLRPRHRQHGLDTLLHAGELQGAAGGARLAVEIHEAADRGAVDVSDRRKVDDDAALAGGDQLLYRRGELRQKRIHQARFPHADDGDAVGVFGRDVHSRLPSCLLPDLTAPRLPFDRGRTGCLSCSRFSWCASSIRPRL